MIVTEVAGIPQAVDYAPTVSRPGILAEMLDRAGVRRVSAAEALALCGLEQSGLWLPYLAFAGEPVMEGGKPYGRLRLDKPRGSKKYHQAFGTGVHVYLPPGLEDLRTGGDVPCVEGEFKAMSLTEAGFPAIGVSGFFGFAQKGGEALLPELAALIARVKPARVSPGSADSKMMAGCGRYIGLPSKIVGVQWFSGSQFYILRFNVKYPVPHSLSLFVSA